MQFKNLEILNGSLADSIASTAVSINMMKFFAVQAIWSGATAAGSLSLEASCDDITPVNWSVITESTVTVAGAGSALWNVSDAGYKWVRLNFTVASGTGAIVARCNTKGE